VSLLLPLALLGLLTLPAILLLHLLRNRRQELTISSLRLWQDLQQRRQGALPRHIPLSLMLLLQLIIATALTLALARPASSFLLDQPERTIFILDMTTSMTALDGAQIDSTGQPLSRFDQAREIIKTHLQNLDENDSAAVISLTPHPEILFTAAGNQKSTALSTLDNIVPGATGANLTAALTLTSGLVDPEQKNRIVVLSDGNYALDSQLLPPVLAPLEWQLISASPQDTGNQALLNASARPLPDGRHRIFSRVVNYSASPVIRTIQLMADGAVLAEDTVEIEPQADTARVWTVSASVQAVAVEIVEPDILPIDNRAELLLLDTTRRRLLLVSQTPETLQKALAVQPGVEVTASSSLAENEPEQFDLIILDGLKPEQTGWPRGNVLVINPPLGHPLLSANNLARNLRPDPETASTLFDGIDLSGVYFNRVPRLTLPDWANLDLNTVAGQADEPVPLVFHGTIENSRVMVWAFDLSASNLPARLALPLLTANMLSTMLDPSPPAAIPVGAPVKLPSNFNVEIPDGHRLFLNPDRATESLFTRTKLPGLYRIYNQSNELVAGFAVHAGEPQESNLTQKIQPDTLAPLDASAVAAPQPETAFEEFWPWLAGLALVVITAEGWFAWRK